MLLEQNENVGNHQCKSKGKEFRWGEEGKELVHLISSAYEVGGQLAFFGGWSQSWDLSMLLKIQR